MSYGMQLALAAMLTVIAGPALAAGTMRCATHVVDQGMTKDEIVRFCGQPTAIKKGDTYWYYDHGDGLLVKRLFFVDEKVEFIDDVSRDEM